MRNRLGTITTTKKKLDEIYEKLINENEQLKSLKTELSMDLMTLHPFISEILVLIKNNYENLENEKQTLYIWQIRLILIENLLTYIQPKNTSELNGKFNVNMFNLHNNLYIDMINSMIKQSLQDRIIRASKDITVSDEMSDGMSKYLTYILEVIDSNNNKLKNSLKSLIPIKNIVETKLVNSFQFINENNILLKLINLYINNNIKAQLYNIASAIDEGTRSIDAALLWALIQVSPLIEY